MFNKPMGLFCKVVKKYDRMPEIAAQLKAVADKDVLVGITEDKSIRKDDELTNAQLGSLLSEGFSASDAYMVANGTPMHDIPPRPFLQPSVMANKDKVIKAQGDIVQTAMQGKDVATSMKRLGLTSQNIVKGWFVDPRNGWPPNAPSTIRKKGSDRPNIDTGALRASITYVIR